MGQMPKEAEMDNSSLLFELHSTKQKYSIGETIILEANLQNNSNRNIIINKQFYIKGKIVEKNDWGIALQIFGPDNKLIDMRFFYETSPPSTDWFITLGPGEKYASRLMGGIKDFLTKEGKYQVTAYYYNFVVPKEKKKMKVWKGSVKSNTIVIFLSEKLYQKRQVLLLFTKNKKEFILAN